MPEDRDSLLTHYRQMRADLLDAIAGLTDAQLTERTLDGWCVKDHMAHIALWDEKRAAEIARVSAGYAPAWQHMTDEQNQEYNDLTQAMRADLSPDQVRWELATTHERLLEAIAGAAERGLDPSLYREAGLRGTHEAQHTAWIRRWRQEKGIHST